MKTFAKFLGVIAIGVVIAVGLIACASVPPTAFETAGSLEGTTWMIQSTSSEGDEFVVLAMNDKTSGVFTEEKEEKKETAFTYTAVYNAEKRTFAGTITLEGGKKAEFSAKGSGIFGWTLTAKELDKNNFGYRTPEQLANIEKQKVMKAEIVEKYGSEYLGLYGKTMKRADGVMITYDGFYGLHQTTGGMVQVVRTAYKLHSKDGVNMTLLSIDTNRSQYASVEGVGAFNIRVNGDTVTISNGAGQGAAFNGTYKIE